MAISGRRLAFLLTERRKELGLKESELARMSGVNQPTVHRILTGDSTNPRMENLEKLARALRMDLATLVPGTAAILAASSEIEPGPTIKGRVPVISWVQAGNLSEAIDLFAPGVAEEWLDCPFPHSTSAFCLVIKGLSMYPDYRPEEIILVEPELTAGHGDDVVARTPDGDVTFKRLQSTEDGTYLLAVNPDFPNRIIPIPEDTVICGVVTGSWMKRRKR